MTTQFVYRLKCEQGCEDCNVNVFTPLLMRLSTLPIQPSFQGHDLVQVFQEQPSRRAAMRGTAVTVACFTGKMVSFERYDAQETINTRSTRARKQPVSFKKIPAGRMAQTPRAGTGDSGDLCAEVGVMGAQFCTFTRAIFPCHNVALS